ncbi:MAG: hypothetical protein V3T86_18145 [Planctomycetota bacterium]
MARVLAFVLLALGGSCSTAWAQDDAPQEEPVDTETPATDAAEVDTVEGVSTEEELAAMETGREKALEWEVEGYLNNRWRYQNADGENKFIWFLDLAADFVHKGGDLPGRVRVNGRLVAQSGSDVGDLLYNTWDTFSGAVNGRLYELYVQTESKGNVNGRLGRMFYEEGTWMHFDGGRLDLDLKDTSPGLQAYLVGGVPVRFGDNNNRNGNWLVGGVFKGQIETPRTRWRLEYLHISEEFEGINDPVVDPVSQPVSLPAEQFDDDWMGATIWHRTEDKRLSLFGRLSTLNWQLNELHLRGRWRTDDGKWTVLGEWYQMFERLIDVVNDLTPYVPMLGSYEPFGRLTGRVTYRDPKWIAQAGLSYRTLLDDGIESLFNHEYVNYYFTFTRLDLEQGKLDATFTATGYSTDQNETHAVGGSLDYRLQVDLTLSTGLDYSLWKYDYFRDTEHEDVWSFWFRTQWKFKQNTTVEGFVEIDDDRFATYTTLGLRVTLRF